MREKLCRGRGELAVRRETEPQFEAEYRTSLELRDTNVSSFCEKNCYVLLGRR